MSSDELRGITAAELKKHNQIDDAWICLDGKVYDITAFIKVHPGGDPILQGVGIDATTLFNNVHPYVNHEKILKNKLVGVLKEKEVGGGSKEKALTNVEEAVGDENDEAWSDNGSESFILDRADTCLNVKVVHSKVTRSNFMRKLFNAPKNTSMLPITNFSQDDQMLHFEVQFKKDAQSVTEDNWTVGIMDGKFLIIKFLVDSHQMWVLKLDLYHEVANKSPSIYFADEYRKMEIDIKKFEPKRKWRALGRQMLGNNEYIDHLNAAEDKHSCYVRFKNMLSSQVCHFGIELENSLIGIPPGFNVHLTIGGQVHGHFRYHEYLENADNILLLSQKSVTPILNILKQIQNSMERTSKPINVHFCYFNPIGYEIVLKNEFKAFASENSWFKYIPFAYDAAEEFGLMSTVMICEVLEISADELFAMKDLEGFKILSCGSSEFNYSVREVFIHQLGFDLKTLHVFSG